MKPYPVFLLFVLLINNAWAQSTASFDLILGLDYSYRQLSSSNTAPTVIQIFERRKAKEMGKYNWRIGINYNQPIASRFYIKTGIRLASVGYKSEKKTNLQWASEFDDMGNYILDPSLPHESQDILDFWFLTIPIIGRIELRENKLTPFIEFGVSSAYYLRTRTKVITDINQRIRSRRENFFKDFHLMGSLSFGINYELNDEWKLFGQPIFRYHFTNNMNVAIEENLFNYGVEIGMRRTI